MIRKSNIFYLIGILLFFGNFIFLIVMIAPAGHYNLSRITQSRGIPVNDVVSVGSFQEENQNKLSNEASYYELEWKLVSTKMESNYRVETYQEFMIYKDDHDKIVNIKPLTRFNYLRYWTGEGEPSIQ